jgi:predicted metal-dependent HD superfamily phosphohydrolase
MAAPPPAALDTDLAVLGDAERAILASDPRSYRAYVEALRAECAGLPIEQVINARIDVLRGWLARNRLFATSGASSWEDRARDNVRAELTRALHEIDSVSRSDGVSGLV